MKRKQTRFADAARRIARQYGVQAEYANGEYIIGTRAAGPHARDAARAAKEYVRAERLYLEDQAMQREDRERRAQARERARSIAEAELRRDGYELSVPRTVAADAVAAMLEAGLITDVYGADEPRADRRYQATDYARDLVFGRI